MNFNISQLNMEELPSLTAHDAHSDLSPFMDSSFFDFDQFQSNTKVSQVLPSSLDQFITNDSQQQQQQIETPQATTPIAATTSPNLTGTESELDKKKRNTLASARFRIKKKLKEQEMEKTVKALSEKIAKYNERITQLEMENSCLKSLILEKNERKSNDLLRSIKEKSLDN